LAKKHGGLRGKVPAGDRRKGRHAEVLENGESVYLCQNGPQSPAPR